MSRLPPVDKLPLAIRKDVRDSWEANKDGLAKKISELLGAEWTIDINPNQIYAYAKDGYAKESPGAMINAYVEGVEWQLKSFVSKYGDDGKNELNTLAHAHVLTMDLDVNKKFSYCGCEVSESGALVILFNEDALGSNIDYATSEEHLTKALNAASAPSLSMSYVARKSIREEYTKQIDPIQAKINEQLGKEITLKPEFEAAYEKLKAAKDADESWEVNLGMYIKGYFEALASWLEYNKAKEDEMIREGVNEAVASGNVFFRVVDEGVIKSGYNEVVVEGDALYLQTAPKNFGVNLGQVTDKLMDLL
ncbi:hypothetical protein VFPPC_06664 [Pochonia chlamydosporia 170]|uniref:Uncharacterized protein n=1 Tax=Pochonia chlamydosporia 170 TaxID=1380566 RepID=A0A179F552_METCM|nr:hypothetical protein VFPPC_06664 [Pochonia chlamydosporia 170]OAQ60532.1 hypothetical protein VFPPC_06664 [Pochonia chlamydosporia 170]